MPGETFDEAKERAIRALERLGVSRPEARDLVEKEIRKKLAQ